MAGCALARGDNEGCRAALTTVTAINPTSVRGAVMLADVLFKEKDSGSALSALGVLLEKQPCNYGVMHKMALLLRRERRLGVELPRLLRGALKADCGAAADMGYRYMQALGHLAANEVSFGGGAVQRVACSEQVHSLSHCLPHTLTHTLTHTAPSLLPLSSLLLP